MSANLNRIPLVMFFGLTTDEDKAVRAAAAREGISPAVYMYRLVLTEPGALHRSAGLSGAGSRGRFI